MQLDRIRIQPRLRNPWQSIDLGWVMARRWWWRAFLAWSIPSTTLFAILLIALPSKWWWLASLIPWWLKPLWDAAPLYIYSRYLFDEPVSLRAAWRATLRNLRWEILPWLTWRRFGPLRSMDMPVTVLEQLRGKMRAQRLGVLHLQSANAAGWLTMVCANLEIVIGSGLIGFIFWMLPDSVPLSLKDLLSQKTPTLQLINYCCFYLGAMLIAPFYTAAGFSLYINRRIELEGWDIEIRFRHMAEAAKSISTSIKSAAAAAILVLLFCPLFTTSSFASDTDTAATPTATEQKRPDSPSQQRIRKILSGADFKSDEVTKGWRLKNKTKEEKQAGVPNWLIAFIETLEKWGIFSPIIGKGLIHAIDGIRFIWGGLLIALFGYLLYRYRDTWREWLHLPAPQRRSTITPEVLFGLDVRADSLPSDVIAQVNALWQQQQFREALSLLYRAALAQLLHRFDLPFRDDMTEGECLQLVDAGTRADIAQFFSRLTRAWQRQAYAHTAPSSATVQDLCAQWQQVFREAGNHAL